MPTRAARVQEGGGRGKLVPSGAKPVAQGLVRTTEQGGCWNRNTPCT
jgi:hypothetical protein